MRQRVLCSVCDCCGSKAFGDDPNREHPEDWFAMNVKNDEKGARPVRKHVCDICAAKLPLSVIKEKLCEDSQSMLIL